MSTRKLKSGFTTGTAAAAAAKAALMRLLAGSPTAAVTVMLLTGDPITIPVRSCSLENGRTSVATVIKDAGDDPDVTHQAEIGARVTLLEDTPSPHRSGPAIRLTGGQGVGRVTKPGLEVPPGEPAINPGPRRMIIQAVTEILEAHGMPAAALEVRIFVPRGEELAARTLNARLGIIGGISILGTTGIVRPLSHEAYAATISSALSVARAGGLDTAVFTTGRRSERFAQTLCRTRGPKLPDEGFIQIGDYFQLSLSEALRQGFGRVILAVMFGKAVKMAQGVPHTHAGRSRLALDRLARLTRSATSDPALADRVANAATARQALEILYPARPEVIGRVGNEMLASAGRFTRQALTMEGIIFDYHGDPIFESRKET